MHIKNTLSTLCLLLPALAAMGETPLWRATKQTVYEPSERNPSTLVKSYVSEFKFNTEGHEIEEIQTPVSGTTMRRVMTYTPAGRLATEEVYTLSGGEWVLYRSKLREYDELTGLAIVSEDYTYEDGKKLPGNCFHRTINRNADGNVVGAEVAVYYNEEYDPINRLSITYGDDGKATAITEVMLSAAANGTLVWTLGQQYTDLQWADFNGQIASIDDLFHGNNRLSAGHYVNDNGTKPYDNYDITATYDGENVTVVQKGLYQGIENALITIEQTVTPTDNGGTQYATYTCYADADDAYVPENYLDLNIFDAWDIEIEASEYAWTTDENDKILKFMQQAEVVYDQTYSYPLEVTDIDNGTKIDRIVYDGYIDCRTIGSIREMDNGQWTVDSGQWTMKNYYDLQGRKVERPGKGIFIHNGKKLHIK